MLDSADLVEERSIEGRYLDAETLRRFSQPNPWRWLAAVTGEWVIIGTTMWACNRWTYWWVWAVGIVVIGTRQHAMGIMAHEGVHYLIARKKFWNDLLANLLSSYALTYPVEGYRTNHLIHHRWLDTPIDPERASIDNYPADWIYPMPKRQFFRMLLRDVVGIYQLQTAKLYKYVWVLPDGMVPHIIRVGLFHCIFIILAIMTGHLWTYLLLWITPMFTIALLCFRLRTAAEHSGIRRSEKRYTRQAVDTMATTRTVMGCPIAQFLLAPYNMSYHIEHHLYPSVPVFRLRALHRHLMKNPVYAARARVTRSYRGLVGELTF